MKKKDLKKEVNKLKKRLKPKPRGSAKKAFKVFWNDLKNDDCSRKTLAQLAFDAGHALRHKQEDK